jgi:toxin ParE1/3/4
MKYEFHPEAEQELYEAAAFYEAGLSGLGYEFADEVNRVINVLLEHPELGARVDTELRHFVLRRFPFSVVYAAADQLLYIVAIAHGSAPDEMMMRTASARVGRKRFTVRYLLYLDHAEYGQHYCCGVARVSNRRPLRAGDIYRSSALWPNECRHILARHIHFCQPSN